MVNPCSEGRKDIEDIRFCITEGGTKKGITVGEAHLRVDASLCVHGNIGCEICGDPPEQFVKITEPVKAGSLELTLAARGNRYGEFAENAFVAQQLKDVMREAPQWNALKAFQKEALDIIASKISRLLSGDPNYADNWHDIQGFAKLVEERLPK